MRDLITIIAAGSLMTACALIVPIVEAVEASDTSPRKLFVQRLSQAGGEAPVSTLVSGMSADQTIVGQGNALPRFVRYGALH